MINKIYIETESRNVYPERDILGISGENKFEINPGEEYDYEIKIRPILGKIYFGRIIFRDDKSSYKWYTKKSDF